MTWGRNKKKGCLDEVKETDQLKFYIVEVVVMSLEGSVAKVVKQQRYHWDCTLCNVLFIFTRA